MFRFELSKKIEILFQILIFKLDRIDRHVDGSSSIGATFFLGLLVAERLATSVLQVPVCLFAPRSPGISLKKQINFLKIIYKTEVK